MRKVNETVSACERVLAWLQFGDPDGEVSAAYLARYPALSVPRSHLCC